MPDSVTQIGTVTIAHGNAVAEGADGVRVLAAESPVYADEIIKTVGDGSAVEIKFLDGAMLSQGPNSTVVLDDYVYDADQSTGEMAVKLLQGTLRSVTGEIVDNNPEGFRIETPLATIGIRGTTTGHVVGANGVEQHVVVDFVDRAVVIGHAGEPPRVITQDGLGVMATPSGLGPVMPAPPSVLANLNQLSSASLLQGAPTFHGNETGEDGEQGNNQDDETPTDGQEAQGGDQPSGENGEGQPGQEGQPQPAPFAMNPQGGMPPAVTPGAAPGLLGAVGPVFSAFSGTPAPVLAQVAPTSPTLQTVLDSVTQAAAQHVASTTLDLSAETSPVTVDLSASPSTVNVGDDNYTISDSYKNIVGSYTAPNTLTGDSRDNTLTGGTDADTLMGGDGDDTIYVRGGSDIIDGGSGQDVVSYALAGASVDVDLSAGTVSYSGGTDTLSSIEYVIGSSYADTIWGDTNDNILKGGDGNDTLWGGGGGADSLYGQGGDDIFKIHDDLSGGLLDGGDGTDLLKPWADGTYDITGIDSASNIEGVLFATTGSNLILQATDFGFHEAYAFDVDAAAQSGTQYLEVLSSATDVGDQETIDLSGWTFGTNWTDGDGYIKITGDVGDETITGTSADDSITGGDGDDVIHGSSGTDTLYGNDGDDSFDMGTHMSSVSYLDGGLGTDTLSFTDDGSGTNDLNTMRNVEHVIVGDADTSVTTICAAVNSDLYVDATAISSDHTFVWIGTDESDHSFEIHAGDGNSTIYGGQIADVIVGGSGDDFILGYGGQDTLTGGGGNDTFAIEALSRAGDFIEDFGDGDDILKLTNMMTTNGAYDSSNFATVSSTYVGNEGVVGEGFVYDTSSGELWYDGDGSTDGGETLVATITMHTDGDEVHWDDIQVV